MKIAVVILSLSCVLLVLQLIIYILKLKNLEEELRLSRLENKEDYENSARQRKQLFDLLNTLEKAASEECLIKEVYKELYNSADI